MEELDVSLSFDQIELPNLADLAKEVSPEQKKEESETIVEDPPVEESTQTPTEASTETVPEETNTPEEGYENEAQLLFSIYKDNGLTTEEEFDGSVEQLEKIAEDAPIVMLNKALDRMHTDAKGLFMYAVKEGADPEKLGQYFQAFVAPKQPQFDISTEEGAKEQIKHYLELQGNLDEEEIQDQVEIIANKNKAIEYAEKYQQKIEEYYSSQEKDFHDKIEKKKEDQIKLQQEAVKYLDTVEWGKNRKDKILETSSKVKDIITNINNSPKEYARLMNLLSFYDNETGFEELYNLLEGKKTTKKTENKQSRIIQHMKKSKNLLSSPKKEVSNAREILPEIEENEAFKKFFDLG